MFKKNHEYKSKMSQYEIFLTIRRAMLRRSIYVCYRFFTLLRRVTRLKDQFGFVYIIVHLYCIQGWKAKMKSELWSHANKRFELQLDSLMLHAYTIVTTTLLVLTQTRLGYVIKFNGFQIQWTIKKIRVCDDDGPLNFYNIFYAHCIYVTEVFFYDSREGCRLQYRR